MSGVQNEYNKARRLLPTIKEALYYNWSDPATDRRLRDIIQDGIRYFEMLASGNELTFEIGTDERRLLKMYCVYADSNSLDEFMENHLSEIITFQLSQEVVAYEKDEENDSSE